MHGRTRKTLLGLGFDTDLIESIDRHSHTVDALRALSSAALRRCYSEEQAQLIEAKIKRTSIPEDVVARVLAASGECCCYCADGNSTRPYQIHHIEPYAATQNHAEDNLLVGCPTHHAVIHERRIAAAEQKRARREWYALVELAGAYRARGISFPFGSFAPVDFAGDPDAGDLVRHFRVTPSTALAVSRHAVAEECRTALRQEGWAVIVGCSGDGKSTLALGVAGLLHGEGWRVFHYRPPADNRLAVREVLTYLGTAVRRSVLILDDVNAWATVEDLQDVVAAARADAAVIATWTQDALSDDPRVKLRLPQWVPLSWERIAPAVTGFLRAYEGPVVSTLQALDTGREPGRVGLGLMDGSLDDRIRRYEDRARTVSEFLFLLRGGADMVAKELDELVDHERADVPVLYAAVEQIADFERHVSPEETAAACASLGVPAGQQPPSPGWVREVFEAQRALRRMPRSRGAYSTVHRDWARRLICAALAGRRTRELIEALLARDFDPHTPRPCRLVLLWSWLKYDPHGTPFVRDWAARQRAEDWGVLVGNTARAGLEDIGLLASEMHIFLHSQEWDRTVGAAFARHADLLAQRVSEATVRDWYALRCLAATVGHACPEIIPRLVERWDPAAAAAALSATHPDYYDSIFWVLGGIAKHSRAWCEEVGRRVDWDQVSRNLKQVRPGDLDTVERCCTMLGQLGVPLRRSMLRRYAEVMRRALERVSLYDLHPGFGHDLAIVLQLFPAEVEALAAALDPGRLAAELSAASPRYWRVLGELVSFLRGSRSGVYREIINLLDRPRFVATASAYGPSHPYELRCLLWLLCNGSEEARAWLAAALFETVAVACEASQEERPQLLEAFSYLDEGLAEKLAARLHTSVVRTRAMDDRPLEDRFPAWRRAQEQLSELDAMGEDYVVGPFMEELVAEVQRADLEDLEDPPEGQ